MKIWFCLIVILGGKDAMSSGFGYFMSAAIVLTLCLVTYIMLHRMVRKEIYVASRKV